jgi:ABC-type multidrug transport system fused ATPase/permease subunit
LTQISGGKYSSFLDFGPSSTFLIATDQRFSQPEMRDLRRLLKYLRPHWPIFTLATFAMLLVGVLESAIGGLIVPIFDQAFVQGAGQRTSTIFGLQHLIPQAPFGAWKMISILLIVFTLAKASRNTSRLT